MSGYRMGAAEGWVVTQDGETIKTGFKNDFEAGAWLHRRQSQSIDWAVRHEGYDIVLVENGKVTYSYKQAAKARKSGLGAGRPREGSEGTAYIDPVGHGWYQVRWFSEDERRYYIMAKRPSKEEAIAYARGKGFKVVDMEKPALGEVKARQNHPIPVWPEFVDAYLEAALWASATKDEEPLDAKYTVEDFTQEAIDRAVQDSNDFVRANRRDLRAASPNKAQHGYDFFLTRNLHGTGFQDRDYDGAFAQRLATAARKFGPVNAYADEDGKVRFGP